MTIESKEATATIAAVIFGEEQIIELPIIFSAPAQVQLSSLSRLYPAATPPNPVQRKNRPLKAVSMLG
jgi:hypothetical protein